MSDKQHECPNCACGITQDMRSLANERANEILEGLGDKWKMRQAARSYFFEGPFTGEVEMSIERLGRDCWIELSLKQSNLRGMAEEAACRAGNGWLLGSDGYSETFTFTFHGAGQEQLERIGVVVHWSAFEAEFAIETYSGMLCKIKANANN